MQLAVCGHGRCGKNTVSDWLADNTSLEYNGSTSEAAAVVCYNALKGKYGYETPKEAFDDRHNHRKEWAKLIWDYNAPRGVTLYCDMLHTSDILNGIRRAGELQSLYKHKMIDLVIWIDRDVVVDPSCEISAPDCDLTILNTGSFEDLFRRLTHLSKALGIYKA